MQISNFNNLELGVKKASMGKLKINNVTLALGCQESIHRILKKTPLPLPWVVKKAFMGY